MITPDSDGNAMYLEIEYSGGSPGKFRNTGLSSFITSPYTHYSINIRDINGNKLAMIDMKTSLESQRRSDRDCGDRPPDRCIRLLFPRDTDLDISQYQNEILVLEFESNRLRSEVAAQLMLTLFGGVLMGVKSRHLRSPGRETWIFIVMCISCALMPIVGLGSMFWAGGVCLLFGACLMAAFYLRSRV